MNQSAAFLSSFKLMEFINSLQRTRWIRLAWILHDKMNWKLRCPKYTSFLSVWLKALSWDPNFDTIAGAIQQRKTLKIRFTLLRWKQYLEETTKCFLTLSDISIMAQKEELMVSLEDIKKYILHRRSDYIGIRYV